jgi:acetyltransferase-like isoleucine patch superfamily enzyme
MLLRLVKKIIAIIQKIGSSPNTTTGDIGTKIIGEGSIINGTIYMQDNCYLQIGSSSMLRGSVIFDKPHAKVVIGDRTYMGGNIMCASDIIIGNDVLISSLGGIFDHDSHSLNFEERKDDVVDYIQNRKNWQFVTIKPTKICNKAWIGYNVIITKGVTIGEGAVVAAGSVVTKNVDAWTLVGGNPAKKIKDLIQPK